MSSQEAPKELATRFREQLEASDFAIDFVPVASAVHRLEPQQRSEFHQELTIRESLYFAMYHRCWIFGSDYPRHLIDAFVEQALRLGSTLWLGGATPVEAPALGRFAFEQLASAIESAFRQWGVDPAASRERQLQFDFMAGK